MAEGFDYAAYQRQQQGGNPDKALLVTFEYASQKQDDGNFKNVEMTRIWIDKDNEVVRPTTDEDRARFADRYESFQKGEDQPPEGTPVQMCPWATPADISACKAERIFTIEQLVEVPDQRLQRAHLVHLKYMARDYLLAQRDMGHIGEMRKEIDALKAENAVLKERLDQQASQEPGDDPGPASDQVTCPHCGKMGKKGPMKRWHFDNCGENPAQSGQ